MSRKRKEREAPPVQHPPGSKFRLYAKTFDEDGHVDVGNCGWISVSPTEMVRNRADAMVFTSAEPGRGSGEDWAKFFEGEVPEWKVSVCWVDDEKRDVRR